MNIMQNNLIFYKFQVYVFTLRPLIGALLMHSIITVSEAGKCPVKLLHRIKLCRFVGETSTKKHCCIYCDTNNFQ